MPNAPNKRGSIVSFPAHVAPIAIQNLFAVIPKPESLARVSAITS
jgi:hypothetical protein